MPIYTYQCESCGVRFERQQSFKDNPLTRCPECNKNQLRKVITPAGIIFKGSGWYATDHKSQSGGGKSAATKPSESKEAAPATTSTSSDSASSSATTPTSTSSSASA